MSCCVDNHGKGNERDEGALSIINISSAGEKEEEEDYLKTMDVDNMKVMGQSPLASDWDYEVDKGLGRRN